jgi:hypothetical protein
MWDNSERGFPPTTENETLLQRVTMTSATTCSAGVKDGWYDWMRTVSRPGAQDDWSSAGFYKTRNLRFKQAAAIFR